jgi:uroporphyrinogen decarboxylase
VPSPGDWPAEEEAEITMNSKERIAAAFAHREGDRVPIFEQSVASDTASEILGREAFTGTTYMHYQEAAAWMQGDAAHEDFERRLEQDIVDLARALHFDMLHPPWRMSQRPAGQLDPYNFVYGDPKGDHVVCRFDPDAKTFQVAERHFTTPPPETSDELEPAVEQAERSAEQGSIADPRAAFPWHARAMELYGDEFEVTGGTGLGIPLDPVWLMACIERPDLVGRLLDARLREVFRSLEAQAALGLRVIWAGGDLAGKGGPIYGPRVFRKLMLPRVKRLTAKCHELGLLYVYRTDGDLWPIEREFFVESDIDGYGEIDYEAGMDLDRLKARHGDRVTFWGNVPCGTVLRRGSERDVIEFTRHIIDVAAPGGGFILGSSNSIVPGTPARNVLAMVETALEHGRY